MQPIDMILYCPNCGKQHIDAPDATRDENGKIHNGVLGAPTWTNPPHRSHKCATCECIWRPADVATNGVADIRTNGTADTWVVHRDEIDASAAMKRVKRMTLYDHVEKECLTDGLDFEHRRCNTTKLKAICDAAEREAVFGCNCPHKTYGICAVCIAEKMTQ